MGYGGVLDNFCYKGGSTDNIKGGDAENTLGIKDTPLLEDFYNNGNGTMKAVN